MGKKVILFIEERKNRMLTNKLGSKLHKNRDEILNFCAQHGRIFIYGTGWIAKSLFQYLADEEIEIEGFCVSDGYITEKIYCNKSVDEIGRITFKDNDGIILGVSGNLREEIICNIQKNDFPLEDVYFQQIYFAHAHYPNRILACLWGNKNRNEEFFAGYNELDEIGIKYGTDKCSKSHNYLNKYEFFLNKWKDKNINVLELGVLKGSSIKMWGEYFAYSTVYGVDIKEECLIYEGKNRKIFIQDLSEEEELEKLGELNPTIIIDDASHFWSHQIKALYHLLPSLKDGGIYILEDLETSFSSYRDANYDDAAVSAYDFCSAIAEVVTSKELLRTTNLEANLLPLKQEIEFLADQIAMISFIHGSCIIVKK